MSHTSFLRAHVAFRASESNETPAQAADENGIRQLEMKAQPIRTPHTYVGKYLHTLPSAT